MLLFTSQLGVLRAQLGNIELGAVASVSYEFDAVETFTITDAAVEEYSHDYLLDAGLLEPCLVPLPPAPVYVEFPPPPEPCLVQYPPGPPPCMVEFQTFAPIIVRPYVYPPFVEPLPQRLH